MPGERDADQLLTVLDLTEYEREALAQLLTLGRTTAPDLAEAAAIPKARIYGVLDDLAERGFIKVMSKKLIIMPGRVPS